MNKMTIAVPAIIIFMALFVQFVPDRNLNVGKWSILDCEGSPEARHENGFVEADGLFYLLGGRGIKPVDIYDPGTNSWTSGAQPPMEL